MSTAQNHPARRRPRLRLLWAVLALCFFPAQTLVSAFAQTDDLEEAKKLNQEVIRLYQSGKYDQALPLAQQALAICEKALGPDHPDVADSLNNLALLYDTRGDYARAEPLYQRSLAIREKAFGPDHPRVAQSLNNLALLYDHKGDYSKAEPLYQRALAILEKVLGADHPSVAISLNNLAELYRATGDYAKAEPLYQRALVIDEKALGADLPEVATLLNNLAELYRAKGDYARAEPLYQRALAVDEKALGPNHAGVATDLNNLALLYKEKGDFARAEPLMQRSLAIREKAFGPDHPGVATALNNLAVLYEDKGDDARAEPLYQRALTIYEKVLGPDHRLVAAALNNLALISYHKGDDAKTASLMQRVLAIREKALGPDHPLMAQSLNNLAVLYEGRGDYAKAVASRVRGTAISEHNLSLNLAAGSERQKLLYLATLAGETAGVVSLHLRSAPNDPAALRLALTTVLRRKGRALDAMAESIAALRQRLNPEQQALLDNLTVTRAQLAALTLAGPGRKNPPAHQTELKTLEEQIEKLEDQISRQSLEFRAQSQPVSIEAVQAAIPTDAALVEFVSYQPWNVKTNQFDPNRYAVYVLSNQGQPTAVDLGDAKEIEASVSALRAVLQRDGNKPLSDIEQVVKPKARALDQKIMQPVRQLLGDKRNLLISPDGALNLIPFAALVEENNEFLVKRYAISYLTSGRDLLRLQVKIPSKQAAVIIANPDFNSFSLRQPASGKTRLAQRVNADNDKTAVTKEIASGPKLGDWEFQPLTRLLSTADEARELQKSLPGATVLTDKAATREAVNKLSGPAILHIATHGFFLEDQLFSPETRGLLIRQQEREQTPSAAPAIAMQNPLLRSGLFFAGANRRGDGSDDDGILTALEASGLDLYGTRLVVLSACDTGLGDVKNGDGVYGLRRALVLAGAETQVMSLWSVSDQGTSELMIDYYKRLKAGEGRSEALRKAQLQMLTDPKRRHPYFWAAFIQSGEWANLDGKR